MPVPQDRRYLESHEWHEFADNIVTIGITQHAVEELTDITFVKLPTVGQTVFANSAFGEIESVKATSDLMSGVMGTIMAINAALNTNPGLVNADPYGQGWIIKIKVGGRGDFDKLMSAQEYEKKTGG